MNIGVNFFGLKKNLYHDFNGTLEGLKKGGFTFVELCVIFAENLGPSEEIRKQLPEETLKEFTGGLWHYKDAGEKINKVRLAGFQVESAHLMVNTDGEPESLLEQLPKVLEFGKENQIKYFVISLMKELKDIKGYVPVLNHMIAELGEAGIQLLYHNHEIECMQEEGTTALDYLLENCPKLMLEPDVGWMKFAGVSSVEWMKKYRDRILLLHLKDIREDACQENRQQCFTAVGEGSIPLKEIMEEARNCPLAEYGVIIDQDDSMGDMLVDLAAGVRHIAEL